MVLKGGWKGGPVLSTHSSNNREWGSTKHPVERAIANQEFSACADGFRGNNEDHPFVAIARVSLNHKSAVFEGFQSSFVDESASAGVDQVCAHINVFRFEARDIPLNGICGVTKLEVWRVCIRGEYLEAGAVVRCKVSPTCLSRFEAKLREASKGTRYVSGVRDKEMFTSVTIELVVDYREVSHICERINGGAIASLRRKWRRLEDS